MTATFWDSVLQNVVAGAVLLLPSAAAGGWAGAWAERLAGRLRNQWLWQLRQPERLTIALAASASTATSGSRFGTTYRRPATGTGPARALAALMPSLCRGYTSVSAQHIKLSGDVDPSERSGDLICLGGVATNDETRGVLGPLAGSLPFVMSASKQIVWRSADGSTATYEGEVAAGGRVTRDYGIVVRVPNPHDRAGYAFVFAGSRTYGTIAAAQFFTSKKVSIWRHVLPRRKPLPDSFAALVSAKVDGERVYDVEECAVEELAPPRTSAAPIGTHFEVAERRLEGKSGDPDACEDVIVVTDHFAAVIDGETDKTGLRFGGRTGGRAAAELMAQVIEELDADADLDVCLARMTERLHSLVPDDAPAGRLPPPSAVFALYSATRREVWRVGDVAVIVDGVAHEVDKPLDAIVGAGRAALLSALLAAGARQDDLRADDAGRKMMLPLLEHQHLFRNHPTSPYGFGAVDGREVPGRFRECFSVAGAEWVALASDGYPEPRPTLEESEEALARALRDPLRLHPSPATKAVLPGAVSYDDRAFLRIRQAPRR